MGIEMDEEKNRRNESEISSENSKVKIFVIKADEESVVADNAYKLVTEEIKR